MEYKSAHFKIVADSSEKSKLDIYLRSEYGQMGFDLFAKNLFKIAALGVEVTFHTLSVGLVEE